MLQCFLSPRTPPKSARKSLCHSGSCGSPIIPSDHGHSTRSRNSTCKAGAVVSYGPLVQSRDEQSGSDATSKYIQRLLQADGRRMSQC